MCSRIVAVLAIILSLSSNNICYAHGGGGGHCGGHCCGGFHSSGLHIASYSYLFGNHYYGSSYSAGACSIFRHCFHKHHYLQHSYFDNYSYPYCPLYLWTYPLYGSIPNYMATSLYWPPYYMNPYYPYPPPYAYPFPYPLYPTQPVYNINQVPVTPVLDQLPNNQNVKLTNPTATTVPDNNSDKNTENEHTYAF